MIDLVVVGSINQDISVVVDELPAPGETVLGGDALWTGGGKGANQAVAAARLGRSVAMVGAVGDDAAGRSLIDGLTAEGIDVSGVQTRTDSPTGVALIAVSSGGENSIVVSPGANGRVGDDGGVGSAVERLAPRALLAQLEVPDRAVHEAVAGARRLGALVVLNPAPAKRLDAAMLDMVDVLVPNRGELATLAGGAEATAHDELVDQARSLASARVVVTLGGDGALVIDRTASRYAARGVEGAVVTVVPALPTAVVDTTAAGDSFCGALVDALLDRADLVDAVGWATRVAAVTVTRRGAQISLPTRNEIPPAAV